MVESGNPETAEVDTACFQLPDQLARAVIVETADRIGRFFRCAEQIEKRIPFLRRPVRPAYPVRLRKQTAFFQSGEKAERSFPCRQRIDCRGAEQGKPAPSFLIELPDDSGDAVGVFKREQIAVESFGCADEKQNGDPAFRQQTVRISLACTGSAYRTIPAGFRAMAVAMIRSCPEASPDKGMIDGR